MVGVGYVFGFQNKDIEHARQMVEQALDVHVVPHESYFFGGDYYGHESEDGKMTFLIQKNIDLIDETFAEPDFPDADILLYVFLKLEQEEMAETFLQMMAKQVPDASLLRKDRSLSRKNES